MEEKITLRIGGQEAKEITVRELTYNETIELGKKSRSEKLNPATMKNDVVFDNFLYRKLCIARAAGITEEELGNTSKRETERLMKVYDKLNELSEDEKRGSQD